MYFEKILSPCPKIAIMKNPVSFLFEWAIYLFIYWYVRERSRSILQMIFGRYSEFLNDWSRTYVLHEMCDLVTGKKIIFFICYSVPFFSSLWAVTLSWGICSLTLVFFWWVEDVWCSLMTWPRSVWMSYLPIQNCQVGYDIFWVGVW